MSCASCASRIERALSNSEGVFSASVNFAAEKAVVVHDANTAPVSKLIDLIRSIGYDAAPAETPEAFRLTLSGLTCASCAARVEKALLGVAGVRSASVNLASMTAYVECEKAPATPKLWSMRSKKPAIRRSCRKTTSLLPISTSRKRKKRAICWSNSR